MTDRHGPSDSKNAEKDLSDALASLSLTTELDSALLDHLNLLDKYMFHVECLSQLFRLVCSPTLTWYLFQAFFELAQANRAKSASGGQRTRQITRAQTRRDGAKALREAITREMTATPEPVIDLGYMSLPAELQAAIEKEER